MMSRYITADAEVDILKYLDEWKTGRFGKKLTWAIIGKSFGYSRQALSGNLAIKQEYDEVKKILKDGKSDIEELSKIENKNRKLKKELADAMLKIEKYEQKYLRWQKNAMKKGVSVEALNAPIDPSIKEELRKRSNDE